MATRGAANRGGGPTTFVGGVRKFKLAWEEADLPVYGPAVGGSGAVRKMRLLRWVRTDERTDDSDNAVPRHPNLVPIDDASIPFKLSRNAAATPAAATALASAAAATGASAAAPAAAANGTTANGTENGSSAAAATTTTTAEAPMETS